jgi:hypothetical protein
MATETTETRAATGPADGVPADVRLDGVGKRFGDVTAVAGVDLGVRRVSERSRADSASASRCSPTRGA